MHLQLFLNLLQIYEKTNMAINLRERRKEGSEIFRILHQ